MLCILYYLFLRGQPRLALLFCWYHLPNVLLLYFTVIFHVILCYVFVFVFVNLIFEFGNKFIHSFIHSFIIHSFIHKGVETVVKGYTMSTDESRQAIPTLRMTSFCRVTMDHY